MDTIVKKIDLDSLIDKGEKIIIELGCGARKKEGRIGIDAVDLPGVDIVADLENGLPFLPDNSVDQIYCRHFLEHIRDFENLMAEMVRVLKPEGTAHISVPHFSSPHYYSDFTHARFFGLYSFYYFVDSRNQLRRKVPNFYTNLRIKIISQRLTFRSSFKIIKPFKKLLGWIVNLHTSFEEYYEENLCYIFPCHGIEIVFTPA